MANTLRDRRAAAEWASASQVVEIKEKLSSFDGLVEIVAADLAALELPTTLEDWRDNAVVGTLRFGFADPENSIPTLEGQLVAVVTAVCQRCLEPFSLTLHVEPRLVLLAIDETADELVEHFAGYEVWELQDRELRLLELVEELLLMALPFAAMHDSQEECEALLPQSENIDGDDRTEMKRPFAALRSQMTQDKKSPTD